MLMRAFKSFAQKLGVSALRARDPVGLVIAQIYRAVGIFNDEVDRALDQNASVLYQSRKLGLFGKV